MLRRIVLTLLFAAIAAGAAAQRPRARVEWGVVGGINIPDYTTNMSETDVKNKLGWQAGITIYAGPVFTVMNDCKQKSGGDLLDFGRVRSSVSYTVGAGIVLMRHLLIDLRYNGQFRSKHDVVLPDGRQLDKLRTYNVAFSFGYLF